MLHKNSACENAFDQWVRFNLLSKCNRKLVRDFFEAAETRPKTLCKGDEWTEHIRVN